MTFPLVCSDRPASMTSCFVVFPVTDWPLSLVSFRRSDRRFQDLLAKTPPLSRAYDLLSLLSMRVLRVSALASATAL